MENQDCQNEGAFEMWVSIILSTCLNGWEFILMQNV